MRLGDVLVFLPFDDQSDHRLVDAKAISNDLLNLSR